MLKLLKKKDFILFLFILFVSILISFRYPRFLSPENVKDIIKDTVILMIVSIGQMMVIVTAGIDLSVASGIALTGMSVGLLNQHYPGIPIFLIILISMIIGGALGSFNGFLIAYASIPPIIMTLGTMSIYRGFVFVLSGGTWVSAHEMTEGFKNIAGGYIFGIPNLFLFAVVILTVFAIFLNKTKTGREVYAIGSNELGAEYAGINVKKIKYLVYLFSGIIFGLAGLLWVSRYASAQNDTAMGFELQTVAACVIGGVSIAGGSGTVTGVILGALFLGIVYNALTVINISPFWRMAISGFLILVAIVVNTIAKKKTQEMMIKRRLF